MKKLIQLLVVAALFSPGSCWASYGNQIVRIKNNPATVGMANAVAGVENGESAAEINPAALIGALGTSMSLNYSPWPANMALQQALAALRLSPAAVFGVSVNAFQSGEMDSVDNQGNVLNTKYRNNTTEVGFSYAHKLDILRITGVGATVRYVSEKIENESSANALFDAGLMFKIENNDKSKLGVAIRNLGSKPKFFQEEDTPVTVSCGLSRWFMKDEQLLLAVSGENGPGTKTAYSGGGEYRLAISQNMAGIIRAGYTTERVDLGSDAGVTAGIGIMWQNFGFNYAWRPSSLIGDVNTMEFKYIFSPSFAGTVNRYAKVRNYENLEAERKQINMETKIRYEQRHDDAIAERDKAIFTQGVMEMEVNDVDRYRLMGEDVAKKGNYDQAWGFINQANMKYRALYVKASARKMLADLLEQEKRNTPVIVEKAEEKPKPQEKKVEKQVETTAMVYQNGLQSYIRGDMGAAIDSFEGYLAKGDDKYRARAKKLCADAYCKFGYEQFNAGNVKEASRLWRRGNELDDSNTIINNYLKEYVVIKCDGLFNKGVTEYSKGRLANAKQAWAECLELDPGYSRAQKALDRVSR